MTQAIAIFCFTMWLVSCGEPLPRAGKNGDVDQMKNLLADGHDINAADDIGRTALWHACCEGHMPAVKLLLENGADPGIQDQYVGAALHAAARCGQLEVVEYLLETGIGIESGGRFSETALLQATRGRRLRVVKLLLERGANPNASMSDHGYGPLHNAIDFGDATIVALLLEHKADPNQSSVTVGRPSTPLHHAASAIFPKASIVKMLLHAGADPTVKNASGHTPEAVAVQRNNSVWLKAYKDYLTVRAKSN